MISLRASIVNFVCGVEPLPASEVAQNAYDGDIQKRINEASEAVANEAVKVQGGALRLERRSRALRVRADALRELAEGTKR